MKTPDHSRFLLIEKVLLLKSLSIFNDTPETILAEIAHLLIEVPVPAERVVVQENEPGDCMYIIFSGDVGIYKGRQLLATLHEKDFFGELSLLDTETRSASVKSETDCILFRIDQEPFYALMETRPEVVKGVMKILCKRIRAANDQIHELKQQINN
jgi:CRP/FNR family cyclic AMP-dependent transcriptional regulator